MAQAAALSLGWSGRFRAAARATMNSLMWLGTPISTDCATTGTAIGSLITMSIAPAQALLSDMNRDALWSKALARRGKRVSHTAFLDRSDDTDRHESDQISTTGRIRFTLGRVGAADMQSAVEGPKRRYEKGEKRFKHVGRASEPEFEDQGGEIIGKCPAGIPDEVRDKVLNNAVPRPNGLQASKVIRKLYAVYKGAIYEARTSDHGNSYHAYPFQGSLSKAVLKKLKDMAAKEKSLEEFERWKDKYISENGAQRC